MPLKIFCLWILLGESAFKRLLLEINSVDTFVTVRQADWRYTWQTVIEVSFVSKNSMAWKHQTLYWKKRAFRIVCIESSFSLQLSKELFWHCCLAHAKRVSCSSHFVTSSKLSVTSFDKDDSSNCVWCHSQASWLSLRLASKHMHSLWTIRCWTASHFRKSIVSFVPRLLSYALRAYLTCN